jgi:cobalt-zinc-cadmium efflux system outer membrane protein
VVLLPALVLSTLASTEVLDLSRGPDVGALVQQVWSASPDLQQARAKVAAARADAARARFLPNPTLDLSLNTIPVGPTNPVDLAEPLLNVPNLGAGVSVLLEVGKRGPRQDATRAAARAVTLDAVELLRQKVLSAEEAISDIASAEVRVAALTQLAEDALKLTTLERARGEKGDTSLLDADRAQLEEEGVFTSLGEARESLNEALRACTDLVGVPCLPFNDWRAAASWLERRFESGATPVEQRPDLLSLAAQQAAAEAQRTLAGRRWAPDPTVRLGYVHDRFLVSGAQPNSLSVGLSIPLNLFDHGQADAAAAEVAVAAAARSRERLLENAAAQLQRVQDQQRNIAGRLKRLREQSLPLAASVVQRLNAVVTRGAAPLQELLLARRTYAELVLTANDLDRASFRLRVARVRITGSAMPLPQELNDEE